MWSVPHLWPHHTQYSSLVLCILRQSFSQDGEQARSPRDNGPGISPWLMMKASSSRLATFEACSTVSQIPVFTHRFTKVPGSVTHCFLQSLWLISSSVLSGITFQINYLPQILVSGNVFWGIKYGDTDSYQVAELDNKPRIICVWGTHRSPTLHIWIASSFLQK